jgi:NAD+ kinase
MPKLTPRYSCIALVYNPDKPRALPEAQKLKHWLVARHVKVFIEPKVIPAMKASDLIIAMGGDGTVLGVSRAVATWNVPVIGVNIGHLGFLAATELGAMTRTLARILAGEGRLETRTLLSASGKSSGKKFSAGIALNDAVLRSGATGRVLWLKATVRGQVLASYAGDGLIIATPTGSTAYNLAAFGPIVHPDLDVLLMSPICPHSLAQRPLVLPAYEVISVEVLSPSPAALLSLDGQVNETLEPGDSVEIRRAAEQVQLLMDPTRTFYQVLQNKLKWGGS